MVILQAIPNTSSIKTYSGMFTIQLKSMTIKCSFSFTLGQGVKFDVKPSANGKYKLDLIGPSIQGAAAVLEGSINEI